MISLQDMTVPTIDEGTGEPVIFLHGTPDSKEEWRQVIDRLKDTHRCIAPDLPGFGASSRLSSDYDFSIEAQVAFFDAFVNQVTDNEKVTLVLHDIGAIMGLTWAAIHPHRVARLFVMNVVFHTDYRWHGFGRIMASPVLSWLFSKVVNRRSFVAKFQQDFPLVEETEVHRIYEDLTPLAKSSLHQVFRRMTHRAFFEPWQDRLEDTTRRLPTRVIWGRQDSLIPESYAHRIGDDVRMLDDCGHWVPLVKPDVVAEEVRTFRGH